MSSTFQSINPYNGELLAEFELTTTKELERQLEGSTQSYASWKSISVDKRAALLLRVAELVSERKHELARLASLEVGKTLANSLAEVEKCAFTVRWFAENGSAFLKARTVQAHAKHSQIHYQPLGPLLAIMPWNFPFFQVMRFAAPALLAGNTVLLKHAPNVPQCAAALTRLCLEAGIPDGVFENLLISTDDVAKVIADKRIRGVTLTGSARAGAQVASLAGQSLKKCVLELGGSDAFIVLPDTDLDITAVAAARARLQNNGQTCIAAKRFLVHESVYTAFAEKMIEAMLPYQYADPLAEHTLLGPLARPDLADGLQLQLNKTLALGAKVLVNGGRIGGTYAGFAPVLLADVSPSSPAANEELFGPVATLFSFKNTDEAISLANSSDYGLGASVWTQDLKAAQQIALALETGSVAINGILSSDARLPFGGVKSSGFGKELSIEGMLEFCNLKAVSVF